MLFQSLKIAISMYSKIPVPNVKWNEQNMKYALCFFPIVGIITAIFIKLFFILNNFLNFNPIFYCCISAIIPIAINGGIHLDGFMDTADGLCSYAPKEKKLEILKDPNTGAFAVIWAICFFIINIALFSEVSEKSINILCANYIFSRGLSGLAVVTFPTAKNTGLASLFANSSHKKAVKYSMLFYIFVCCIFFEYENPILGTICILSNILSFIYVKYMSKKHFGGITGDIAGFLLHLCETLAFLTIILTEKIILKL